MTLIYLHPVYYTCEKYAKNIHFLKAIDPIFVFDLLLKGNIPFCLSISYIWGIKIIE